MISVCIHLVNRNNYLRTGKLFISLYNKISKHFKNGTLEIDGKEVFLHPDLFTVKMINQDEEELVKLFTLLYNNLLFEKNFYGFFYTRNGTSLDYFRWNNKGIDFKLDDLANPEFQKRFHHD